MVMMTFDERTAFDVIDGIVDRILNWASIYSPAVDVFRVLMMWGKDFSVECVQGAKWLGLCDRDHRGRVISYRAGMEFDTTHFVLGHELGEHLMDDIDKGLGRSLNTYEMEHLSNWFSARLLCPVKWFRSDCIRLGWDLQRLKARYSTAPLHVIAYQWLTVADSPMIVSLLQQGYTLFRRSNGPAFNGWHPLERKAERLAGEREQPIRLRGDGLTVDAWPVTECGIRRVILRTECLE